MRLTKFIARRLLLAIPQILAITVVTFVILRILPGNPAYELVGPFATPDTLNAMEHHLGTDRPLPVQYGTYISDLLHGNWGDSWFSTRPVTDELKDRLPATLELITLSSLIIMLGGLLAGLLVALTRARFLDRGIAFYGLLSGSFPDFWLALALSYIFFFKLGWLPSPTGRLDIEVNPPQHVTGFYTVDSLLTQNWTAFRSAFSHLILPVLTLSIVYTAGIVKMTRSTVDEMLRSNMCTYARACGLPDRVVLRYALRNGLPPILTLMGLTYGYLLGGDVLVEKVFSWNGLGSYVVDSVVRADYSPVQAFVLLAAMANFLIYLVVDLTHLIVDPRLEY